FPPFLADHRLDRPVPGISKIREANPASPAPVLRPGCELISRRAAHERDRPHQRRGESRSAYAADMRCVPEVLSVVPCLNGIDVLFHAPSSAWSEKRLFD